MWWFIGAGVIAAVVGIWMWADGSWLMTDAEYQERIAARRKARAAKAAEAKR